MFAPARVEADDPVDETIASAEPTSGRRRLIHPAAIMPGIVLAAGVAAFSTFGAFLPDYSRSVGLATSGGLFAVYALVVGTRPDLRSDVAGAARPAACRHDRARATC